MSVVRNRPFSEMSETPTCTDTTSAQAGQRRVRQQAEMVRYSVPLQHPAEPFGLDTSRHHSNGLGVSILKAASELAATFYLKDAVHFQAGQLRSHSLRLSGVD